MFLIAILSTNIYTIETFFQKPTQTIYLTYKNWWIATNCYLIYLRVLHVFQAIVVICWPEIALNKAFLICSKVIHIIDVYILFPIFLNSVFLLHIINSFIQSTDLYSNVKFYFHQQPTLVEHILSAIIWFQMGIAIIIIVTSCYRRSRIYYIYKVKKNLINRFESAKRQKWNSN